MERDQALGAFEAGRWLVVIRLQPYMAWATLHGGHRRTSHLWICAPASCLIRVTDTPQITICEQPTNKLTQLDTQNSIQKRKLILVSKEQH